MDENFSLKWKSHRSHTQGLLSELISSQEFADVTLVCDDARQLKAHKFMLSSCSTLFKSILQNNKDSPFIYLRGIKTNDMMAILEFIYLGETTFDQDRMKDFLQVGNDLGIKELKEASLDDPATKLKTESQRKVYFDMRSADNSTDIKPVSPSAYYYDVETGLQYEPKPSTKPKTRTESRDVALAEFEDREKFLCDICNKAYYNKVGLAQHIESIHEGKKYACDECSYEATRQFQLREHKKALHSGTTYQCSTCNWTCKWKTHMTRHLKTHEQVQENFLHS